MVRFIDLFAGIGGFHQAMISFGGKCVLASDIDKNAIEVYKKNYNIDSPYIKTQNNQTLSFQNNYPTQQYGMYNNIDPRINSNLNNNNKK